MPIWDYYEKNPEEGLRFSRAMTDLSRMATMAVSAVYKYPESKHVVDVGGGHGTLLAHVLSELPGAKGTLLDLPHVIDGAGPVLRNAKVLDRVELVGGDFTKEVPAGGDLYLLKTVIHDWDDAEEHRGAEEHQESDGAGRQARGYRNARPGGRLVLAGDADRPQYVGHLAWTRTHPDRDERRCSRRAASR